MNASDYLQIKLHLSFKVKVNLVKVKKNYNCDFIDINQLDISQIERFKHCLWKLHNLIG